MRSVADTCPIEACAPSHGRCVSASLQYLYFLRFSLVFWALPALLWLLDAESGASAITRGILTPVNPNQFGATVFFTVSLAMVVLLTARAVVRNGQERFGTLAPAWLRKSLGSNSDLFEWRTLLVVHLPGGGLIFHYWRNAKSESVLGAHGTRAALGYIAMGLGFAVFFWWLTRYFYVRFSDVSQGSRELLPSRRLEAEAVPPNPATSNGRTALLDDAGVPEQLPVKRKPCLWTRLLGPGYSGSEGKLYDSHRMLLVAAFNCLSAYAALYPFTSPLRDIHGDTVALALIAVGDTLIALVSLKFTAPARRAGQWAVMVLLLVAAGALILLIAIHQSASVREAVDLAQRFPVIAPVLILLMLLCFILTALAFFADRHRIPVLTTFFLYVGVAAWLSTFSRHSDHFFSAAPHDPVDVPIPSEILNKYMQQHCPYPGSSACPMIIVTATGGGIHAASWTATVLTQLERTMQENRDAATFGFHDHILYASTVSGGSVGFLPFLREYYAPTPFRSPLADMPSINDGSRNPLWFGRIRRSAHCSSLEAVAWGLEYGDLFRLLTPFIPGLDNRTDRSIALEQALTRNTSSRACDPLYGDVDPNEPSVGPVDSTPSLTLAKTAGDLRQGKIPAFTMNTTAAETGGRFLLGNYQNGLAQVFGERPASSFLDTYRDKDIALATAARLSATFPYVSSAARLQGSERTFHFIDGGYIDNDGVSSAIEFLEQALPLGRSPSSIHPDIMFIEIRDGADLDANALDESDAAQQKACASQNEAHEDTCLLAATGQLEEPLVGFWNAGHGSITRRNRRELAMFLDLLVHGHQATVQHIVFDYVEPPQSRESTVSRHQAAQPLSWYLTPSQMNRISTQMTNLDPCVRAVATWARHIQEKNYDVGWEGVICNAATKP